MAFPAGIALRRFAPGDADRLGAIWWAGFAVGVPGVTPAHDRDDVMDYMGRELPARAEVWVAAEADPGSPGSAGRAVAFLALHDGWVEQLYVDPPWFGRGVGDGLLAHAKTRSPAGLQLWTFQVNVRARRFYEARGFVEAERTDGADNDERAPDIRYVWPGADGRG